MAANNAPQFTKNGVIGSITVTAANTKSDGAGTIATDIFLLVTGGADGTYIEEVLAMATATVAATATTATVLRVFVSNKTSGTTSSAETFLIAEVALPAVTADHSTTPIVPVSIPINRRLPANWTLLVTNHAAPAANTAWRTTAFGGDY